MPARALQMPPGGWIGAEYQPLPLTNPHLTPTSLAIASSL